MATLDSLLPLAAIARMLSVPEKAVRSWRRDGTFPDPVILPDGRLRWRRSEVAGWLAGLRPVARRPASVRPASGQSPANEENLPDPGPDILRVLRESGDWLKGPEIEELSGAEMDHTSGSFRRAVRILRERGLIESNQTRGYRASPHQSGHRPAT